MGLTRNAFSNQGFPRPRGAKEKKSLRRPQQPSEDFSGEIKFIKGLVSALIKEKSRNSRLEHRPDHNFCYALLRVFQSRDILPFHLWGAIQHLEMRKEERLINQRKIERTKVTPALTSFDTSSINFGSKPFRRSSSSKGLDDLSGWFWFWLGFFA